MAYNSSKRFITYPVSTEMYAYIEALLQHGVITGDLGNQDLSSNLKEIAHAIHNILASGAAHAVIDSPGAADTVKKLDDLLAAGTKDANELNESAGIYISIAP